MKRIGVDIGGTFTDCVLWDEESGLVSSVKVSSDREDPSRAVMVGIGKLGSAAQEARSLMHGTTVATNASLERSGPRIGMICTSGFRDVLEIARLTRTAEQIYDLKARVAPPLVERRDRIEIAERIDHQGRITTPLEEASVVDAARLLARRGITSIAVCLLHSYVNGEHERRVRDIVSAEIAGVSVSISSEVLPEFREYERFSTTVLNAYLTPVVSSYLARLGDSIAAWNPEAKLWIMQSNGGVMAAPRAAELPVTLLLSGPSGGVVAGRYLMDQVGIEDGITIDMGGTSFDVCLLAGDGIPMAQERRVMDMPIKGASVDILTVGAGGGSIGWVDVAGQFRVGPQSAGSEPGPACYGRGGTEPTVTDANLVLGMLGPEQRLGGEVSLDIDLAMKACERLGRRLGLNALETAWGIRRVVNANMAGATRAASVGRGHDPRDFSLIAFGGAGPMHAVDIAAELDIPGVIVPAVPGCQSAFGLVVSDVIHDYVSTHVATIAEPLEAVLERLLETVVEAAHAELADEDIPLSRRDLFRSLDLRYVGEQSTLNVPIDRVNPGWLAHTARAFHLMHARVFGFSVADEPVEVVNIRLRAVGRLQRGRPQWKREPGVAVGALATLGMRRVSFGPNPTDITDVPVYARSTLVPGATFAGPAVIQQDDSTLLIPPRRQVRSDRFANLLVDAA